MIFYLCFRNAETRRTTVVKMFSDRTEAETELAEALKLEKNLYYSWFMKVEL
jgi:hypothetical protein